ncbi:unnamed protein product [Rodentolepis nana]|uniref:PH domain-containing protein n=1 Tax=Rodentolepis nana TaxID=102285 RepID=A0A158QGK6_RODNA|nr:unnamed protein product [Rodentolepis nana]
MYAGEDVMLDKLQQIGSGSDPQTSNRQPRSFSLSGEITTVDGHSRSLSPAPLSQTPGPRMSTDPRRTSSNFGSDGFISRSPTTSPQALDNEIDTLLEDLTTTCLQQGRGDHLIRVGARGSNHHFPQKFSTSSRPRFDRVDGNNPSGGRGREVCLPELAAYMKVCKPRAFGIKTYRRFYVVLKKTSILMFKVSIRKS